MKFSEQWLRLWVNPKIDTNKLTEQLTMAGLEVDSIAPVALPFTNVVVGKVLTVKPHPNAERLRICEVNVGAKQNLTIVCGAKNVCADLKVAVALLGALLPGDLKIKKAKLRGIESCGMICSAQELGLGKSSDGIMELPSDAPLGKDLRTYFKLDDNTIEIELTPNRGDCLSIAGIAREIAVINRCQYECPKTKNITAAITDKFPIHVTAKSACPRYIGRVIRNINNTAKTPLWMQERLRRSEINAISPVVDVTNYVMLELGQPLHAFDLAKLHGGIQVRYAKAKETIILLDGQKLTLNDKVLVIADEKKAMALAGVMGGLDSGVNENTQDIFLESAFFDPILVANSARLYGLQTDSAYRFARGVDYNLQHKAIQRVTELLLDIVGGKPGPISEVASKEYLPKAPIILRENRIKRVLGITIAKKEVNSILQRLGMQLEKTKPGWSVTVPSHRFDIQAEIDLLEELARIYGYNQIPNHKPSSELTITPIAETKTPLQRVRCLLVGLGYHEAITYSFVDTKLQELLAPEYKPLVLKNPLSLDMAVMRTSILPGLIKAVLHNQHRQQERIRLFETGLCFITQNGKLQQLPFLGGVAVGNAYPEQWGIESRALNFFDVKGDIETLLQLTGLSAEISFLKEQHAALHPGRSARIYHKNQAIGYLGELHPQIKQQLDIKSVAYIFELDLAFLQNTLIPKFMPISKFPMVRRDIAIIVDEAVFVQRIKEKMLAESNKLLCNVEIFDIYQGQGVEKGKKSVALNLIFQHTSRTLVDEEIDEQVSKLVAKLRHQFGAILRG